MATPDEVESLTTVVRRILQREIDALETLSSSNQFPPEGLDRLAKCALILQRIRRNDTGPGGAAGGMTDEQLMRRAEDS